MAGRFEGLSDLEWPPLCRRLSPRAGTDVGVGMPHTPFRQVVNTLLLRADHRLSLVRSPARPADGPPRARPIGGCSGGRLMAPSRPCRPGSWGLPRHAG